MAVTRGTVGIPRILGQSPKDNPEPYNKKALPKPQSHPPEISASVGQIPQIKYNWFLLTGTMWDIRYNIEKEIINQGGYIASSVSSSLSFLVVGDTKGQTTSKMAKAHRLGVKIITEGALRKALGV